LLLEPWGHQQSRQDKFARAKAFLTNLDQRYLHDGIFIASAVTQRIDFYVFVSLSAQPRFLQLGLLKMS